MQQADTATTPKEKVARARGVVLFARLKAVSQVESSILMVSVIRLDGASLLRNVTALLVSFCFFRWGYASVKILSSSSFLPC